MPQAVGLRLLTDLRILHEGNGLAPVRAVIGGTGLEQPDSSLKLSDGVGLAFVQVGKGCPGEVGLLGWLAGELAADLVVEFVATLPFAGLAPGDDRGAGLVWLAELGGGHGVQAVQAHGTSTV